MRSSALKMLIEKRCTPMKFETNNVDGLSRFGLISVHFTFIKNCNFVFILHRVKFIEIKNIKRRTRISITACNMCTHIYIVEYVLYIFCYVYVTIFAFIIEKYFQLFINNFL